MLLKKLDKRGRGGMSQSEDTYCDGLAILKNRFFIFKFLILK